MNDRISPRFSRWAATADLAQSLTGGLLALFLWVHLLLVSSILLGPEAMRFVARNMELAFLDPSGQGYPVVVSVLGLGVLLLVAVHAVTALRKFPQNLRQWRALNRQLGSVDSPETRLWRWQVITGFVLFLLLPAHLWMMINQPETIGPEGSAARVWDQRMLWLYLPLLAAVELHAVVGVYRLVMKWCTVSPERRALLVRLRGLLSVLFIGIGLASLLAFVRYAQLAN
ncbi:fumarate reductase cytochrome b subunit [Ferrimonas balearica]|uniref:fumarate reductase cytochrome b subunit n=1 Tax=Ferrimonas balearica TaxID=44012 RepID=UPI001C996692|nr:fumarate reductase cytochrome b subunit [Ferrimonas balearica]MBY5923111.1 fumarate reductase cytochrome b subunit [Ferrimonas balearica]MBY5997513.1 fumarate reductase cytochrome b subunit [Ferrimonas balearica]